MNKSNSIRKKALEHAKKRQWDKALKEYQRLAELEQHNPNVFNELGDLHLKMGNKRESFESFHSAIDAYSRVGLYNNAVAVCKKIIRLNSTDQAVFGKLANLRNHQGFKKEAATYAVMFLDMVVLDVSVDRNEMHGQLLEMASEMNHAPEVLERVAEYLLKWEFKADAGEVFSVLVRTYASMGMTKQSQEARKKMEAIGFVPDEEPAASAPAADTNTIGENDQVELEVTAGEPPPAQADTQSTAAAVVTEKAPDGVYDFDTVELEKKEDAVAAKLKNIGQTPPDNTATATAVSTEVQPPPAQPTPPVIPPLNQSERAAPDGVVPDRATPDEVAPDRVVPDGAVPDGGAPDGAAHNPPVPETPAQKGPSRPTAPDEVWVPKEDIPDDLKKESGDLAGEFIGVNDIVGQFQAEVKANIDEEDYRSHYDLGMAYLEMDLLPEAVREFQFASNSTMYQVRSLEMIGLCFLKQKQPRLAIKQLLKGLSIVGDGDRDSLGLQYNLGLSYEMTGELAEAQKCFEEVYIVDVTFRDVTEKLKKYSS